VCRLPFVRILRDGKDTDRLTSSSLAAASLKKEAGGFSGSGDEKAVSGSEVSPGKKHAKRVREVWAVNSSSSTTTASLKTEDSSAVAPTKPSSTSSTTVTECNNKSESSRSLSTESAGGFDKPTSTASEESVNGDEKQSTTTTTTADSGCNNNNVSLSDNQDFRSASESSTATGEAKTSLVVKSELSAVKTENECDGDVNTAERRSAAATPRDTAGDEDEDDPVEALRRRTGLILRDADAVRRRWAQPVVEEENYQPDQASLNLVTESQDALGRRAIAVSTIFRNLSFVPGNEPILGTDIQNGIFALFSFFFLLSHTTWQETLKNLLTLYTRRAKFLLRFC
jgi:hypothetical protein